MKKFRLIAAAFLFAVLAISCNKEVDYAENAAGGYSFNFTIASSGFDGTKADATVGWTSGEKVYVFFKPANGSLLGGSNYVAFTYDGENWSPSSFIAPGALGEKGKMSAVYVPCLASTAVPEFSNGSWTIDGGTVYYSCASAADYEVKNETVYGVLSMRIPDGYVQFVVDEASARDGDKLLCNYADAYDCVTLNPDMNFSETPAAGNQMVGHTANGKTYFWGKKNNCTDAKCEWTLTNSTGDVKMEASADAVAKNRSYNLTSMPEIAMVQLWENGPYWSTVNLGATKPEETGDYYAWGEIEPKTEFTWATYKWSTGDNGEALTKYVIWPQHGTPDYDGILNPEDDAAYLKWGGKWRLPSASDLEGLLSRTTCTAEVLNGVNGYRFTGIESGYTDKSIFLPNAGYYDENGLSGVGTSGSYWADGVANQDQYGVILIPGSLMLNTAYGRYCGMTIRPVYADRIKMNTLSLDETELALSIGGYEEVPFTYTPSDSELSEFDIHFVSSDESVVECFDFYNNMGDYILHVDPQGKVGTAVITAYSDGNVMATLTVTVDYPYVDLGLSVKWATYNVGASVPEDYGDYYAWGDIEPYYDDGCAMLDPQMNWKTGKEAGYDWTTYKWCEGTQYSLTKYNKGTTYGTIVDNKTVLELADDVARQKWGGNWRMPTYDEWNELLTNCTWSWTTLGGVNGYVATSSKSGYTDKSIFLPAAGYRCDTYLGYVGTYGYYWSSTIFVGESCSAFDFNFYKDENSEDVSVGYLGRNFGQTVRPVCSKE